MIELISSGKAFDSFVVAVSENDVELYLVRFNEDGQGNFQTLQFIVLSVSVFIHRHFFI